MGRPQPDKFEFKMIGGLKKDSLTTLFMENGRCLGCEISKRPRWIPFIFISSYNFWRPPKVGKKV